MVINKIQTRQKKEESSSLKNQKILFVRRPDITPEIRFDLSIAGLGPSYRDSTIAALCAKYKVSHEFIYSLCRLLKQQANFLFSKIENSTSSELDKVLESMRFFIEGKIETQGSLHGLSNFAANWGGQYTSTCFISQSLEVAGNLLESTLKGEQTRRMIFLCDEVYSGKRAILVTIESKSMTVLDIKLLEKPLDAAAWKERFLLLEQNNIIPSEVIKDGGKAMQAAQSVLAEDTLIGADTFHATSHRLGIYRNRFIRQINASILKEEELQGNIDRAVSVEMWAKQQGKLEIQQAKTAQLLEQLDWFEQAYFLLTRQLRPFTSKGMPRNRQLAEQNMEFALEALGLLDLKGLADNLKHIKGLIKDGTLLQYMDKVPVLYNKWSEQLEPDTLWLWMLYWLWWKKSFQTHSPSVQARAKSEALAAAQLLQAHYANEQDSALFQQIRYSLFADLDTIVQASSLVETFNSILKPFIKSARGQLNQSLLNLVAFYHNHRVFHKRCKRGGYAPIELLNGITLQKPWIDLLMDKIKNAFIKHQITSLKQLHVILFKDKMHKLKAVNGSKIQEGLTSAA